MAEHNKEPGFWDRYGGFFFFSFWALVVILHQFEAPPSPENTYPAMLSRMDREEAADAEFRGDDFSAEWWHRQAQKDENLPR